jgi:hypothetical protein
MFKTIAARIGRDTDYPERQWRIDLLTRVLTGRLYDSLQHPFHEERNGAGEYIPLAQRRPSARYGLCRVVVDDSVSLLFDEGHFPMAHSEDKPTAAGLAAIAKDSRLNEVMIDAATRGSVGSVAVLMRVLKQKSGRYRIFFQVMETQFLTPTWDAAAPDTLLTVREQYKVRGSDLVSRGYVVDDPTAEYWFARQWDDRAETWFLPWPVRTRDGQPPADPLVDEERSVEHRLGFLPMVWIMNLPGGDGIDGACTFPPEAIDAGIAIDYQLSQLGRGLKYSSDPTLLIKEPSPMMAGSPVAGDSGGGSAVIKGGDNAILVGKDGDAKLLEINGSAASAVLDYVRCLREFAMESAHGNRANADKVSAAQSGRAMEMMNQSLIWLADKLRITYGESGLVALLSMVARASQVFDLALINGIRVGKLNTDKPLSLKWPRWYALTADDRLNDAKTLVALTGGGIVSRETATGIVAATYDIEDVAAETARVKGDTPTPPSAPPSQPLARLRRRVAKRSEVG